MLIRKAPGAIMKCSKWPLKNMKLVSAVFPTVQCQVCNDIMDQSTANTSFCPPTFPSLAVTRHPAPAGAGHFLMCPVSRCHHSSGHIIIIKCISFIPRLQRLREHCAVPPTAASSSANCKQHNLIFSLRIYYCPCLSCIAQYGAREATLFIWCCLISIW